MVIDEPESSALESHVSGRGVLLATSRLAIVEVARACRLANPSEEVGADVDRLLSSCMLVAVSSQLLRAAGQLTTPALRTLNAIHLASALRVEADEMLVYDRRLLAGAGTHGLRVVSPDT